MRLDKLIIEITCWTITLRLSEVKMSFSKDILTAAHEQEVVITMLPNGEALIKVVEAIIPVMPKGSCFIDCSTVYFIRLFYLKINNIFN